MVAEDDPDDRFLIKNAFETIKSDPDLQFVNNGEELLSRLDQIFKNSLLSLPDTIILDLNMPKISGHQVLMDIKNKAELGSINIVVLSTSSQKSDIEFCKNCGVHSFYTKPDSFDRLVEIIKAILAG